MILKNVKEFSAAWKAQIKEVLNKEDITPKLVIIQVGNDEASNRYVRNKMKDCAEVGISPQLFKMKEDVSEEELKSMILNEQEYCDGIFVQMPLPKHINKDAIISIIDPKKDVDGFTLGSKFKPCTPLGIMHYLDYCDFKLDGANVLVIGRSDIVGKPMAQMLTNANATVTLAHSHTKNLWDFIKTADLIITAVGNDNFNLNCYPIHIPVIDVAIRFDENGKMRGDCINTDARDVTPVPGGVGLLTRCALLYNMTEVERCL